MSVRIAPSVLSADLGRLREQVERAVEGGAGWKVNTLAPASAYSVT